MREQPAPPPALSVPAAACDAHLHVFDLRFPSVGRVKEATAVDYQRVQKRLGTHRAVIVTPRVYGTDNAVTLDAIAQLGVERTRGVAVLTPDASDTLLASLHAGGVRGVRFTLYAPDGAPTTFGMVEPLAHRIHELGWHVQLHWTAEQITHHAALLARLPCPIVFDHMARLPLPQGSRHPAFEVVGRLLDAGRAWVKLSGPYLDSALGRGRGYSDVDATARAFVARAPTRLVWGSDWPHTTEKDVPDDADLVDQFAQWVTNPALRHQILVDNATALYDFAPPIPGAPT